MVEIGRRRGGKQKRKDWKRTTEKIQDQMRSEEGEEKEGKEGNGEEEEIRVGGN